MGGNRNIMQKECHPTLKRFFVKKGRTLSACFNAKIPSVNVSCISRQVQMGKKPISSSISISRHLPRQGRGFVKPPVCPTPPAIHSSYGGASGGQFTDCWHPMSSYGRYILFLCYCIVCHMSLILSLIHI